MSKIKIFVSRDWAPIRKEPAFGQLILKDEQTKIFRVHFVGHPGGVGVPGHEVVHRLTLAHEIILQRV